MEDLLSQDVVGRFPSGAPVRSADDAVAGEHGKLEHLQQLKAPGRNPALFSAGGM
jgi:hypothetical protein